jgi:hypothetical protein
METDDKNLPATEEDQEPDTAPASEAEENPSGQDAPEKGTQEPADDAGAHIAEAMKKIGVETEGEDEPKKEEKPQPQNDGADKPAAAAQPAAEPETQAAPQNPAAKLSPEQEEAELIRAIPSDRGRARISQLLSQGRQARSSLAAVQRLVSDSGLDQESLTSLLTIAKNVSSKDPQALEEGLRQLEAVRANLYRQVGREAPGVDLVARYSDLQKRVTEMGMRREDALEIAKARQIEEQRKAFAQQEALMRQERVAFEGKIQRFQQQTVAAFQARQNDPQFEAKIEILKGHFTPEKIQEFVRSIPPEQWMDSILYLYDNANPVVRKPNNFIAGRPSRNAGVKAGVTAPGTPDGIAARIAQMGL